MLSFFVKVQLYEDFSKTRASRELESSIVHADNQSNRGCHVFQVSRCCRNIADLCNYADHIQVPVRENRWEYDNMKNVSSSNTLVGILLIL